MDNLIYSSRSRIESFLDCPRLGYIRYLWDGRGLSKRAASVYLSTGTYTHVGLQLLFEHCKVGTFREEIVDDAVKLAIDSYQYEIKNRQFDLEEGEDSVNQNYIISEQCALVEAFIRAFAIRVLPDILSRFKVVDVEREEQVISGNFVMQGRIDVILEEISTSDIYIVSFKTAAQWDRRQEKANEHDNQGLSETWILEERLKQENNDIRALIHDSLPIPESKIDPKIILASEKYRNYLSKFLKNEKIMGVIMIYLLKGKRYESSSISGRWEQHSPLIRAYRKLVGAQYEYAPSLYYNNPSNKSGKGRLGKGWEPFNVWEDEEVGFIKGWIAKLADSTNNNMGEDIIGNSFKIPAPYFRNQEHIDSWVRQSLALEDDIQGKLDMKVDNQPLLLFLDKYFPQRRKGCHYPVDCEMLDICYNSEIFQDPIGSGKYQYRKPHHKMEEEAHEKLYNIMQKTSGNEDTNSSKGSVQTISKSNSTGNNKQGMERSISEEVGILDEEAIIEE